MSTTDRPGGLTALAVINFIFFGFDVLAALSVLGMMVLTSYYPTPGPGDRPSASTFQSNDDRVTEASGGHASETRSMQQSGRHFSLTLNGKRPTRGELGFSLLRSVVCGTLLLLSGLGYLRQSRIMGRYLGCAYAVTALLLTLLIPSHGFQVLSLIIMVYPIVTLVLVNAVFNHDLVH